MRASGVSEVSTRLGGISGTAEDLSGEAFAVQEKRLHDANGRLQKTFVQNSGNNADAGLVSGFLETENVYDILGDVRQVKSEVGTLGETSTWHCSYDANQNLIEVTQPMGNVTRHTAGTREGFLDRRGVARAGSAWRARASHRVRHGAADCVPSKEKGRGFSLDLPVRDRHCSHGSPHLALHLHRPSAQDAPSGQRNGTRQAAPRAGRGGAPARGAHDRAARASAR